MQDLAISPAPTDAISDIQWSVDDTLLSVSSWDCQTRIYQISPNGSSTGKCIITDDAPALCTAWSNDNKVFSGGCSKTGKVMDIITQQTTSATAHDAPIKSSKFIKNNTNMNNILVTGSWDKTIKYWDFRASFVNPVHSLELPERCYSLDTKMTLMAVATADRHVLIYDLNNPCVLFKSQMSPLKWQSRVISCFNNGDGYAIGSIEGRVGIEYIHQKDASLNFSFKCHRQDTNVYSINDICFHPVHGTFTTAGGDGCFNNWDKDCKQRLKTGPNVGGAIVSCGYNHKGNMFAYGVSYDWTKGHEGATPIRPSTIYLHPVKDEEVMSKNNPKRK